MSFSKGDKVRVEAFEGVVSRCPAYDGRMYIKVEGEKEDVLVTGNMVTRLDPENWPPQAGDIWVTPDGQEWYVREMRGGGRLVIEMFENHEGRYPAWYTTSGDPLAGYADGEAGETAYKELHPVLVRRREADNEHRNLVPLPPVATTTITAYDIQRAAFEQGNQWYRDKHWDEAVRKGWVTIT